MNHLVQGHIVRDIGLVSEPSSSPLQDPSSQCLSQKPLLEQSLWCGKGSVVLASVLPSWVCENITVGWEERGREGT